MKFKTKLLQAGKTATGIEIPAKIIEGFGVGKKPPVRITINGYTYRNTVAVMGGVYMVGVSAEHRKGANVNGGDEIEVTIELDTQPREVDIPEAFEKALKKNGSIASLSLGAERKFLFKHKKTATCGRGFRLSVTP